MIPQVYLWHLEYIGQYHLVQTDLSTSSMNAYDGGQATLTYLTRSETDLELDMFWFKLKLSVVFLAKILLAEAKCYIERRLITL